MICRGFWAVHHMLAGKASHVPHMTKQQLSVGYSGIAMRWLTCSRADIDSLRLLAAGRLGMPNFKLGEEGRGVLPERDAWDQ